MFTGLVEAQGTIVSTSPVGRGLSLVIQTELPLHEVAVGDSIAVDGACLTVEALSGDRFTVVAARETVERSTLGAARAGRRVHLERAMALGGRLDGHLVQGHVDGMGQVQRAYQDQESWILWIELAEPLCRYVAPKGSITVDGVSLTVNEVDVCSFRVNSVPHTASVTHLAALRPGDRVNVEVDILAKYVERLLAPAPPSESSGLSLHTLARTGFSR